MCEAGLHPQLGNVAAHFGTRAASSIKGVKFGGRVFIGEHWKGARVLDRNVGDAPWLVADA
eukprot:7662541-Pyramimonas_sp.AAC.1